MSYLILLVGIGLLFSCSKSGYKPDHDQTSCERCMEIKTKWQEPEMIHQIGDSVILLDQSLCGELLTNFKRNELPSNNLTKICNTNGEAIYWIHYRDTSFTRHE